jgi:hypothetical protein
MALQLTCVKTSPLYSRTGKWPGIARPFFCNSLTFWPRQVSSYVYRTSLNLIPASTKNKLWGGIVRVLKILNSNAGCVLTELSHLDPTGQGQSSGGLACLLPLMSFFTISGRILSVSYGNGGVISGQFRSLKAVLGDERSRKSLGQERMTMFNIRSNSVGHLTFDGAILILPL